MYIAYPIYTVIGELVVLIIVADKVIPTAHDSELIRINDISANLAVIALAWMKLLVGTIAAILKLYLTLLFDSLVKNIDSIEKLLVRAAVIRHCTDMTYLG